MKDLMKQSNKYKIDFHKFRSIVFDLVGLELKKNRIVKIMNICFVPNNGIFC